MIKLLFSAVVIIFLPIFVQADFRYNVIESCGPRNYCFVGGADSATMDKCIESNNQCKSSGGVTSICYYVADCKNETNLNPGTIGAPLPEPPTVNDPEPPPPVIQDPAPAPPQPSEQITERLKNPIVANNFFDLLDNFLKLIMYAALPLGLLAVIFNGFLLVTAQGDEEKLKKAKTAILYTVLGLFLILGSRLILTIIKATFDSINL